MVASSISLSDLDGTNGFRLDGIDAGDFSGRSVASAGDVNGDGVGDLIVGADGGDPNGNSGAGESYVVFGSTAGFASSLSLSALDGTTGFRLDGIDEPDNSGRSVASAGDVNGDGVGDLIVGAYGADPDGNGFAGESYVVFGSTAGFAPSLSLSALDGTNGFRLDGIDVSDGSGRSVASAGDVNGDGVGDLIVGARFADPDGNINAGESYVVFGSTAGFAPSLSLSALDGTNGFRLDGIDARDYSGFSVASAGDVNGDGVGDLIVGAYGADPDGNSSAGESYVVFGSTAGFASSLSLSDLDGVTGFRLDGIDEFDRSGISVASAGDVNGDGVGDLIVGAVSADPDGKGYAGESYVVFGSTAGFASSLSLSDLDGVTGFRLDGIDAGDASGRSVSSAGDVNGDGVGDLIIGADGADPDGNADAGESYVVFGSAVGFASSLSLSALDGTNGFRMDGIDGGDFSGVSVASAGDVNGDGIDDLIVGAFGADPDGNSRAGESYVVFGKDAVAPTLAPGQALSTPENRVEGAMIGRVIATDHIGVTGFSIDGGDPGGFFAIDATGRITLTAAGVASAANDFETGANSFTLSVTASDAAGNAATEDVTVTVTDVAPPAADAFAVQADGTLSGNLGADNGSGPDAPDLLGLVTVNGEAFAPGAEITLASGARLTVNADLSFDYDPNGAFAALSVGQQTTDSFTYARAVGVPSLSLSALNGSNGFRLDGIDAGDFSGRSVASAGDVNGDGIGDLIVGALGADPDGKSNAGESYVVFGSTAGFAPSLSLSALDGTNGFRLDGIDEFDRSGFSVASAGDVNGDGLGDLILGADGADPDGKNLAGESYIVFGSTAGFASSLSLSALDGTTGFRLEGIDASDRSGFSVASAGDVNGDGIDDLIIGASNAGPISNRLAGESYVVFGSTAGFASSLSLSALDGINGFRLGGIDEFDYSGTSVASAGDVNGDGLGDLIIGARRADPDGEEDAGESYVVFGSTAGFDPSLSLSALDGGNGFRIDGIDELDFSGGSVASAGDVNGDGFDDLIVGAPDAGPDGKGYAGESYVVFGSNAGFGSSLSLSALNGTNGFRVDGIDSGDYSGFSVASAGDVNGDGIDDLIVGAIGADPNGDSYAGESYVVFGSTAGFASNLSLSALDGTNGFRLDGIDARDYSGRSVASAGDVNGDGFDDLIVGADGADPDGNSRAGESYVVFGRPDFTTDPAVATVNITGIDDAAVVSGRFTGAVTEGDPGDVATATGTLAITDVDADDMPSFADVATTAGANGFGSFALAAGTWTYTLDQVAVQDLDAGDSVTDTITFTATDGTEQAVSVTVTGTDDAAVVSGVFTGAVTEGDPGDVATATGTLAITDVDTDDTPSFADVATTAGANGFGSFALAAGTWTYTLDQVAVQDLDAGDSVTDTITFTATDGTEQAVSVTITGTDDDDTNGSDGGTTGDGEGEDGANDGGGAPTEDGGPDEDDADGGPGTPATGDAPEDGSGRTLLRGTEGRDRIFGTAADERFEGLGARDVLVSGGGDDLMLGGAGPDFFAFASVGAPGTTEVVDFGPQDFLVIDDQFFGLGDATIDLRGVTLDQVLTAVRAGFVTLDREEGTLSVDPGRDARGEAPELTIALDDGLSDLGVGDVFLA